MDNRQGDVGATWALVVATAAVVLVSMITSTDIAGGRVCRVGRQHSGSGL